nr:LPS export ABC transporter permease LptG [Frigidibacter sp. ROC022]
MHLYFARRFLTVFLGTFLTFAAMLGLIDMLEQIRSFDMADIGFVEVLRLTLLNLPAGLARILPLITILASVILFLNLARTSELVISRAAGRSALWSLTAPVAVAAILGVLAVAGLNPIVAATSKQYEVLANRFNPQTASVLSLSQGALWLRQGGADGQTVIRASDSSLDGTELKSVTFLGFDPDGSPAYRIEADRAHLADGAWQLTGVKEWRFDDSIANPEREAVRTDKMVLESDLTVDRIRDSFGTPSSIPIWDLPRFIRQLEDSGFSARSHRVWFQMELSLPVLLAAMVMVGAGFTMRHVRFGHSGVMVLLALMMGFGVYFIRNFAQVLGDRGQIPVELAAWSPPVAAVLLSLGLLLHLEDG